MRVRVRSLVVPRRGRARYGLWAALGCLSLTTLAPAPATGLTHHEPRAAAPATGPTPHVPGAPLPRAAAAPGPEADGTARAAARAAAAGIAFGACPAVERLPDPVRCGTVRVPLDYADPDGRQITLTVSRAGAIGGPAEHQGALVYNPGGPGASSMYFPLVTQLPEWRPLARAYDLVGYAPRGVGRSAPLSCVDPGDFVSAPSPSPTHPSPAEKERRIAKARAYAEGCARRAGDTLRHYTSLNNARDLDVLRAALHQERLTYMGASYGTYFGALYATLFPAHVRRMVFDSAVNPARDKIWYRNNLDQSRAFETRWADFRAWVARHDAVFGLGTTPEAVAARYEEAKARLATEPAGGVVGPGQLHAAFLGTGYYDDYWAPRARALSDYLRGDDRRLIAQAAPHRAGAGAAENSAAVYTAVECNDAPWPVDWEVWDRDNTALARVAPFETWDNAFTNLPCAFWRAPRREPLEVRVKRGSLPPVLILAAERDAATPYAGARELARRLKGSVLITEEGAGTHGLAGGANDCVNAHVERYLLTGQT
ncbi:alpha/beta hydrolase, partial [Streptomyces sp. NPDC057638]|uniref:alpha/beta hydrolase n=1 Tax=Streptomyces sp. NPDC057638 TaxID=3346190 RepID=UPI00369796AA